MRQEAGGVSPVIGEVLMVAIVVILAAIAYIIFAGMLTDTEEEPVLVNLSPPVVRSRGTVWDASIEVERIVPHHTSLHWVSIGIVVSSVNGSALNITTTPQDDVGSTYHDYVEFWYVDIEPGDGKIDAGDSIKITGLSREYEGATVRLVCANEIMGTVTLPADFP